MHVFFVPHPPLAIPEIGGGHEQRIKATLEGFHRIGKTIGEIKPETIIFITPHGNAFREALSFIDEARVEGDFGMFGHYDVRFSKAIDQTMTASICKALESASIPCVRLDETSAPGYGVKVSLDHGVMVPMHYIDLYYTDYKVVHMTSSFSSADTHLKAGQIIREVVAGLDQKTVIVASGDLSHALKEEGPYSYNAFGEVFDKMVTVAIEEKDPGQLLALDDQEIEAAAQCGLRSYCLGFGYAGKTYNSEVFSYEGPFGVGYLTGELRS